MPYHVYLCDLDEQMLRFMTLLWYPLEKEISLIILEGKLAYVVTVTRNQKIIQSCFVRKIYKEESVQKFKNLGQFPISCKAVWCGRLSQNLLRFTLGNVTQMALFPYFVPSYLPAHFPVDSTSRSFQTGKHESNQTGKKAEC